MRNLIAILLIAFVAAGCERKSQAEKNENLIRVVFTDVIENPHYDEAIYRKYFAENYRQQVGNHSFGLQGFLDHMKALKRAESNMKVEFDKIIATDDHVTTIHRVVGTKRDGSVIETKLISVFTIANNQITSCDELAHVVRGEESDKDLASVR